MKLHAIIPLLLYINIRHPFVRLILKTKSTALFHQNTTYYIILYLLYYIISYIILYYIILYSTSYHIILYYIILYYIILYSTSYRIILYLLYYILFYYIILYIILYYIILYYIILYYIILYYIILYGTCAYSYMIEYVYKIPDNLMCNLHLHNSHLCTHTYIQKRSILTTCIYFIEYSGTWKVYVPMTTCFSTTRYSNITKVPSLLTTNSCTPF